ncbi:MAG: SDR family NAD(P)-dependent oxidoreductase [Pseudomonadota bacterium]|nr:SDR family NAD(P)-dependent oxidoreductase [Pseudomonadota bacterium]
MESPLSQLQTTRGTPDSGLPTVRPSWLARLRRGSLYSMFKSYGPSGFGYGSTAEEVTAGLDLSGKTILVTGVTSGLGLETARVLSMRGARIVGLARTAEKAREAMRAMPNAPVPVACDLADLATVAAAVATVSALGLKLDAVICNAGIMALPKLEQKEGYELQFFTNHVGHFALVTGLVDALAEDGRVVVLSSSAHSDVAPDGIEFDNLSGELRYDRRNYGQSKLANLLFAKELARRFAGTKRAAIAVHPGVIQTNLGRYMSGGMQVVVGIGFRLMGPLFLKTVPQGAATQVWAAAHPDAAALNGEYLADCNVAVTSDHGRDMALAARLWETTEGIVARVRP